MKHMFLNQSYSTVKVLVTTSLFIGVAFTHSVSQAQTTAVVAACASAPEPRSSCPGGKIWAAVNEPCPSGGVFTASWECKEDAAACTTFQNEITEAQTKASAACTQANLGSFPSCLAKMKECMETSTVEGTETGIMDQILPFAGQLSQSFLGTNVTSGLSGSKSSGPVGKCPNMSSRDYFEQKDRITREINTKNKEIADLQKEIADATKDFNEQKADMMKESAEAQEELNERLRGITESQSETNAELLRTQSEIAEKVRQLNTEMMAERAQMAKTDSQYVQQLGQMTNRIAETKCMVEVTKERAELKKAGVFNHNAGGVGAFGQQNARLKVLQEMFDNCLKRFREAQVGLQTDRASALQLAQNKIANIQENINESNQALESVGKQIAQRLQELEKERGTATQEAVARTQAAQQQLNDGFTALQERQKAIATQQATITSEINGLNQDIAKLGPQPASGSTSGWREAQNALIDYRAKIVSLPEACQQASTTGMSPSDRRALDRLVNDGRR